jgi:effector-binding domain-containing protein
VASLVYTGGLEHLGTANDVLMDGMRKLGLEMPNEYRECYHHFEGDRSPNNVTQVMFPVR